MYSLIQVIVICLCRLEWPVNIAIQLSMTITLNSDTFEKMQVWFMHAKYNLIAFLICFVVRNSIFITSCVIWIVRYMSNRLE